MEVHIPKFWLRQIINGIVLCLGISALAQDQNAFLIKFNYKGTTLDPALEFTPKAIDRRSKFSIPFDSLDYPVNLNLVTNILNDSSLQLRYTLKWHNAIVVNTAKESLKPLEDLDYVSKVYYVGQTKAMNNTQKQPYYSPVKKLKESAMPTQQLSETDYGKAYAQNKQIEVTELHKLGYDGSNITAAVFDAGFNNIDIIPAFMKHQANNKLMFGYDWVDVDSVFNKADNHGTAVTSCFGAYDKGRYIGSGPGTHLILFRTEYGRTEYPIEELNWCKAAETADYLGVDMITSSLGYNQYDDQSLSYTHPDLDGTTSYVSLAARTAVNKGIFVLNSAGNEGDSKWFKIGTPADVEEVLTVGAVDKNNKIGSFSSKGYTADGRIKPDVCALGVKATVASSYGSYYQGYGTSYATPVAAGGVACLLQAFPNKRPQEIAQAIRITASNNNNPDSLQGYGTAKLKTAYDFLQRDTKSKPEILKATKEELTLFLGDYSDITLNISRKVKVFWFIKKKKTVYNSLIVNQKAVSHIDLSASGINCRKNYTIKLKFLNDVENYTLKKNDLYFCSD